VRGKINRSEEAGRRRSPKRGEGGGDGSNSGTDGGSPVAGGERDVEGAMWRC
jgi:hypothetical protein